MNTATSPSNDGRPAGTDLSNWRDHPRSVWAFRHVDEVLPVAPIAAPKDGKPLPRGEVLDSTQVNLDWRGRRFALAEALAATHTDSIAMLHQGRVVLERHVNGHAQDRHILFSVSKSVTGTLAGALVATGELEPDAPVIRYVPEVASSAYGSCTVRHVLDMTVNIEFVEDYLDPHGPFARYRAATGWNPPNPAFGGEGLHQFLAALPPGKGAHGRMFHYVSPNSDLLGWILERASGQPFNALLSSRLWAPMGALNSAHIAADPHGAQRTAGGICATLGDLARFGELMRREGEAAGRQLVPASWIADIRANGDRAAWNRGSSAPFFRGWSYRSQWYTANNAHGCFCAIGIHGQWIYIDPAREVVVVKFSSQPLPVDDDLDQMTLALFDQFCQALA